MSAQPDPPDASKSASSSTASADALPRTQSSTTLRLSRGEIPSTWTQPAEVVSTLPAPAPSSKLPVILGAVLGVAVVAAGVAVILRRDAPPPPPAPPPVVATAPPPIESIPLPPPTSSTKPSEVAPEDQGGEPAKPEPAKPEPVKPEPVKPEPAKPEPAKVEAAKVEAAHVEAPIVNELPARKKARELTQKAIASLRANDFAAAEPVLVRAVLVDPSYADAWRHLGIARAQLGDRANARRAYKKYLTLSPDAPDAEQVKAILASP